MDDFCIDKVAWHTSVAGNPETRAHVLGRFWVIARFLQENGLTTRQLASSVHEIDDNFEIRRSDLTEQGYGLIKSTYDKWLRSMPKGQEPSDSLLRKGLSKMEQLPSKR